jgi:predicted amidohydrolase YtcJ
MIIQGEVPLPDDSTGLLSCHRVKLFADGSLGAKTAALREPYCRHGSSGGGQGVLIMSQEELVQEFRYADEKGYRLEVHVIGDQAAEVVLDALEEANISPDQRPILTQ